MLADYSVLLLSAILVNNFVLVQLLGLSPAMGVSNKVEAAMGMAMATTFVLTLTSACTNLVYRFLLVPLELTYLTTFAFVLVIAAVVQLTAMVVKRSNPTLCRMLGIFFPLITVNCAVLGLALLNIGKDHSFLQSLIYGFGGGAGFSLVLVLFTALRERLALADVPGPFKGAAVGMITAGLISLAFMGFAGLV